MFEKNITPITLILINLFIGLRQYAIQLDQMLKKTYKIGSDRSIYHLLSMNKYESLRSKL